MTPFDRKVRARIYDLFTDGAATETPVTVDTVAASGGWSRDDVVGSFSRLDDEHLVAIREDGETVWMAHPFSGVETPYRAVIGQKSWFANCAWDTLAILALLGDGVALGPDGLLWEVVDGRVHPDGVVRLLVPLREFWDDIGFT